MKPIETAPTLRSELDPRTCSDQVQSSGSEGEVHVEKKKQTAVGLLNNPISNEE